MGLARTRLNSLSRLSAVFERASFGGNAGAWAVQASGATPEADTGPGSNSGGPYVYCNAAGAADETAARANSILTLRQYIADEWTGTGRLLQLAYCVTGAAFDGVAEGLEVEALRNGAWQHRVVLNGWPYSDTNEDGDTVTDVGGTDHVIAIDGNWVRLTFTIPDDATNLRLLLRLNNDTDLAKSNAALWDMRLVGGANTQLREVEDYRLLVDWDNDGTYGNSHADVWPHVIEDTFDCFRGRDFASQRVGRSRAGTLAFELDNRDGLYDPDNTLSALHGLVAGGRRVRWQVNDGDGNLETQWTGWLDEITPVDRQTGLDRVRIEALGVISRLDPPQRNGQENRTYVEQRTNITTGAAARLLFDATADAAIFDEQYVNGDRELARWWSRRGRLEELRDLEQAEGGFLWERKDGLIALDASANRQDPASRISQAMFTDEDPAAGEIPAIGDGIRPDHPHEDLANIITSEVSLYRVGAQSVLWEADGIPVASGADFNVAVRVPHENSAPEHVAISSWTDLAAGTDYTARGGLTLTLTTDGNEATIRIQNTGAAFDLDLQVRGVPIVRSAPLEITTPDQDSIDAVGQPIPYPFSTPWLSDPVDVRSLHTFLLRVYGEPAERLTLTWEAGSDLDKATELDLSDRVSVMRRGIGTDYFIESIRHRVTEDFHFITMTLSPSGVYGEIFVLGVSRLGEGILAA